MAAASNMARTTVSQSLGEANKRVARLYKAVMREIPLLLRTYALDVRAEEVAAAVRRQFRKHQTNDPRVIDMLVFRGEQELLEAQMHWKQKTHIIRYLESDATPAATKSANSEFMASFYNNTL